MTVHYTEYNAEETGNIIDSELWENFGDINLIRESDYVECGGPSNLAYDVLNTFGISCSTPSIGGAIKDVDIKKMEARTVINLSLIEYAAITGQTGFYEAMVNEYGEVEFKAIGTYSGQITDIYYEIETGSYKEEAVAVMVTGGKPLVKRKQLEWKPIWGTNPTRIYSLQDMLNNCHREAFSRYATIVFKDPQLDTAYRDGIDNLYEIDDNNPWDTILGYVKYKEPPKHLVTPFTKITYANQSAIPVKIGGEDANGPDMGVLQPLPTYDPELFDASCWTLDTGTEIDPSDGVKVDIPEDLRFETKRGVIVDKFMGVSKVYLVGFDIDLVHSRPKDDVAAIQAPSPENSELWVAINTQKKTTRRLTENRDYVVAYENNDDASAKDPYIVFTKDVRQNDKFTYGQNTKFYLYPYCEYARQFGISFEEEHTGTIFPYSKTKGLLVQEIWVYVDIETPSIIVEDPSGQAQGTDGFSARALEIARNLKYYIAPIVVEDRPAPIGYRGPSGSRVINQLPLHDNDPTTVENFEDTDLEQALDEMHGGGMTVSYSFMADDDYSETEEMVLNMAEILYEHMNSDVIETVYTCGPSCNPQLGGSGLSGGVVNSIRYAYTDSGSYTISVTEGPNLVGNLAQVDGGPTEKMNEDMSAGGTIIDSVGDGMTFKVRIDGFGERWAISMTHDIIRVGDKVQCTVHNCPIEQ